MARRTQLHGFCAPFLLVLRNPSPWQSVHADPAKAIVSDRFHSTFVTSPPGLAHPFGADLPPKKKLPLMYVFKDSRQDWPIINSQLYSWIKHKILRTLDLMLLPARKRRNGKGVSLHRSVKNVYYLFPTGIQLKYW